MAGALRVHAAAHGCGFRDPPEKVPCIEGEVVREVLGIEDCDQQAQRRGGLTGYWSPRYKYKYKYKIYL
jgi:hypothetical protein